MLADQHDVGFQYDQTQANSLSLPPLAVVYSLSWPFNGRLHFSTRVLHPGESLTEIVEHEIHVSMATIECRPRMIDTMKDQTAHVVVKTSLGQEYLLCSLGYGLTPQQNLDLVFQPQEQISFVVEGTGIVYLTGYTIQQTESVSCYGEGAFDEGTVDDGRIFPQEEDNGGSQEWESEPLDDDGIITVKTENDLSKEECQEVRHADSENPEPGGMVAMYDTINNKNEPTLRSTSTELSSHEVEVVANIESVGDDGDDGDIGGDVERHETEEWSEEKIPITEMTETLNEAAVVHLNRSRISHQSIQKCAMCSNIIPHNRQLDNHGSQLADSVPSHCLTCSERLRFDREKCARQFGLAQGSNRKPLAWNALPSISESRNNLLAGNNQFEHCSVPNTRQWRASKDRLYSFYCSYCSKTFTSQAGLKIHERTHTGEKPYKCRFCPKAFTQCTNWKSHEKTHTGEKPHKCSYCEKTFIRSDAVKSHERTHTGEKPYRCQKCPRAYGQRSLLKKHELLHHNPRI